MRLPLDRWLQNYNRQNPFGYTSEEMKKYYPITWSHIGADFVVPIGTPIFAPLTGEIFKVGVSPAKGNVGVYVFKYKNREWALELCHLNELPKLGKYSEGDVIAHTGATGGSVTGPHLHCVIHRDAKVTANYAELANGTPGSAGRYRFLGMVEAGKIVNPYTFFV